MTQSEEEKPPMRVAAGIRAATYFINLKPGSRFAENVELRGMQVTDGSLIGLNYSGLTVKASKFKGVDLTNCNFDRTRFIDVIFDDCKLDKATFNNARFERVGFDDCIMAQAEFKYTWLSLCAFEDCVLAFTNFKGSYFQATGWKKINWRSSILTETVFSVCELSDVDLSKAILAPELLDKAEAGSAFTDVQLIRVNLTDAMINPKQLLAQAELEDVVIMPFLSDVSPIPKIPAKPHYTPPSTPITTHVVSHTSRAHLECSDMGEFKRSVE